MPQPLKATLPPDCLLPSGYTIRITALDPTTGATVPGVTLSDVSFFVTDVAGFAGDDTAPMPLLVPSDQIG